MIRFKIKQYDPILNSFAEFRIGIVILFMAMTLSASAQVELVSGGSANAYTLSFPGVFSYSKGITVTFKAHVSNTGASSININGLGAITIKKQVTTDLVADDIRAFQVVTIVFDSTNFQMTSAVGNSGGGAQTLSISNDTLSISSGNSVVLPSGISSGWNTTGNSATNTTSNFIGTTDSINLDFRTNNIKRMKLFAGGDWLLGDSMQGSGPLFSTAGSKTFFDKSSSAFRTGWIGVEFLGDDGRTYWDADSVGSYSFASGYNTVAKGLRSFATGQATYARGTNAAAFGSYSKAYGTNSFAIGSGTRASGTGSFAVGSSSIANGDYSSSLGRITKSNGYASLVIGRYNDTIVGVETSMQPTTPLFIVGNGTSASALNNALVVRNDGNIGVGTSAPATKLHIVAPSAGSGLRLADGSQGANKVLTSDASGNASWQTAPLNVWGLTGNSISSTDFIGTLNSQDLRFQVNGTSAGKISTTGNVTFGLLSANSNTIGFSNVAIGTRSLYTNTVRGNLIAIGDSSLFNNSAGFTNIAIGSKAMFGNSAGSGNTALGFEALYSNLIVGSNTAIGYRAMYYPTGQLCTAIGTNAGAGASGINSGTLNTYIGAGSTNTVTRNGITMVGAFIVDAQCTADNQMMLGSTSLTQLRAQVTGITAYSDARFKENIKEDVAGLAFITRLKPVTYTERPLELHRIWGTPDSVLKNIDHTQIENIRFTGFLAQDVEKAAKESGFEFTGIDIPRNNQEVYSLRYVDFIMPLVKAMQELNAEVKDLRKENGELKAAIGLATEPTYQTTFTKTNVITTEDLKKEIDELKQQLFEMKKHKE